MRILFFTYDFPFPTNSGGKTRAFNMMKFGGKGHDLFLFSFYRNEVSESQKKALEKIGIKKIELFKRKGAKHLSNLKSVASFKTSVFHHLYFDKKIVAQLKEFIQGEKIEIVHFESFYTGFYISQELKELGVKQIFGTENIEYKIYEDYIKKIPVVTRLPFSHQVSKIKKEEKRMVTNSDLTIAVTDEEAAYFKEIGAQKTAIIPNGVDIQDFTFKKNTTPAGSKILFVGNFSYFPNRDAIEFFYNDVFKSLGENLKLTIIGKGAKKLGIKDPRVECIEFVEDIRTSYYDADVMVSPIRIGGGTNFKIIEAMACGLPVVAHPARIESLNLNADEQLLVAETPSDFIDQLTKLLSNDALQGKLATHAREFIEKNYSWQAIGKKLSKTWEDGA